ncbi:MAG: HAD family hydrolase, partial [Planctomycetota bacterium]
MRATAISIPALGPITESDGMKTLGVTNDGLFHVGVGGVEAILATGDGKVEFVSLGDRTMAHVRSAMGYPAWYPVHPVQVRKPIRAVLMDLDGTSVHSESFCIWIIERTT